MYVLFIQSIRLTFDFIIIFRYKYYAGLYTILFRFLWFCTFLCSKNIYNSYTPLKKNDGLYFNFKAMQNLSPVVSFCSQIYFIYR
eukprot:UN01798